MFFTTRPYLICSAILICFLWSVQTLSADIILRDINVPVTEDFDDFRGNGFAPGATGASGQLDSDTYRAVGFSDGNGTFGGTHESGDFARGTAAAAVAIGGTYAFQITPSNYAVGVQPTDDDFNPGEFTIRVQNGTGNAITGIALDGAGYFYNDTDHSTPWTFAISLDDNAYLPLFTLDSPGAADTDGWDAVPVGGFIPFFSPLADGDRFYLRITGAMGGMGDRDQFALDNLSITAVVPEPSSIAILVLMMCPILRHRSRRKA